MKILRFYILYRLPIIMGLIILGIVSHIYIDTIFAWICYVVAFISLILYFAMGPMRLVQEAVAEGDVDAALKYIDRVKFPRLLFKPIRVVYYSLQSQLALASSDLGKAEDNIRKSLKTKSSIVGDMQGANLMQLGFIQIRQGNAKEARQNLLAAVKAGLPDKDSAAATYLQLCSLELQRSQNRIAKEYFRKAKAQKPKAEEIVKQLKAMEKQLARVPG